MDHEFINLEKSVYIETNEEKILQDVLEYNNIREVKSHTRRQAKKQQSLMDSVVQIGLEIPIFKKNIKSLDHYFSGFLKSRHQNWKRADIVPF